MNLTPREKEIAGLLANGASKKEIAYKLSISTRTVENIARSVFKKIKVNKVTGLSVWWFTTTHA